MSTVTEMFYRRVTNPFVRFVIVGGINFLFGTGVYCLLIYLGVSDWWAFLVANVLGVLFNFKTTGVLVFKSRKNSLIVKFALCYAVIYFGEVYLKRFMVAATPLGDYWSGIASIVAGSLASFVLLKEFVFKTKNSDGKEEN